MFARPLAKAGQISVGFFGKGSVSLWGNGGCSAGNRRGRDKKEDPNNIRLTPHDAGVIGDPAGNGHRRTRRVAPSTEPVGEAKEIFTRKFKSGIR